MSSFGIPVRNGLGVGLLASTSLSTRNSSAFSPAALFAAGEQGAWYDPSDLTSMRQLSTGAGAAAVSSPVGFIADKRLMDGKTFDAFVAGQPELAEPINTTNWTDVSGGKITVADGSFTAVGTTGSGDYVRSIGPATVTGQFYQITITVASGTGAAGIFARVAFGTFTLFTGSNVSGGGTYSVIIAAGGTGGQIDINPRQDCVITGVSVKAIPGNHATQSNAAQRPTYGVVPATGRRNLLTYTEQFDNAYWNKKTNLSVNANAGSDPVGENTADALVENTSTAIHEVAKDTTPPAVASSTTYTLSVYLKANGRNWAFVNPVNPSVADNRCWFDLQNGVTGTTAAGCISTITNVGGGWYRCTVSCTTGVSQTAIVPAFGISTGNGVTSYLGDGTSGILIWGAQLETGSTATAYQRVVTAFDVTEAGVPSLSYLSFDGSDDSLSTGSIVWGTGDVTVTAGQQKLSDAAAGTVLAIANGSGTVGGFELTAPPAAASTYRFGSRGDVGNVNATSGNVFPAPDTGVITGLGSIPGAVCTLRRNAVQIATNTTAQGTINYTTNPLHIGRRGGTTQPYNGQIFNLVVRNALTTGADLANLEAFVAGKTGVTI